ncbi:hypothetical protein BX600DRAFT_385187 [Xylariales sp. PMI_506]|nr:hypothetical protein BX600DRAFT_385187 [Xylariales sp. PMI_506]
MLFCWLFYFGATVTAASSVFVTPHDSYSSSVGALGCKINTNRIAYWPMPIDCDNICVRVSYDGRTVNLLRVDTSGGAYDISYDSWNYLVTGYSALLEPTMGGAVSATYENVSITYCTDLLDEGKLPLSAANSMNYLAACLEEPSSWTANNYVLYNILDPVCNFGVDEICTLNWPNSNQAVCNHVLGIDSVLDGDSVFNIQYGTGKEVLA